MSTTLASEAGFPSFDQVFQGFADAIGHLREMAPRPTPPDAVRVRRAIDTLIAETNAGEAVWLESCIRCGQCTTACHYFQATGETKYAPLRKMNLYRRIYQRELGPFRWWYRLVTPEVMLGDLADLQELVDDSCSECGRCAMVCSMGIDIASLVHHQRSALVAAELVPPELAALRQELNQVNETGAEAVVVSCASCRLNFEAGRVKNHWDKQIFSLVELVADHLIEDVRAIPAGLEQGVRA